MQKAYVPYIAALLMLGSNGCVASLISMSSHEIVLTRCLLGALTMLLMLAVMRHRPVAGEHRRELLFLWASGAALAGNWLCMYEGYVRVGVGVTTLLTYLGPVLVMAASPVLFRERLRGACVAGFAVVFAGVVMVSGCSADGALDPLGLALGFCSALFYLVMVGFSKRVTHIAGVENSFWQTASALVVVAIFVLLRQGPTLSLTSADLLPVLWLGVVNTGVGVCLYFIGVNRLPAQSVAVLGYLEALSAVVFGAIFLGETMSGLQIAGAALILGGAVFAEVMRTRPAS
ncbi:MAG: DMT family transporter [Coriobacteriia bacterium]|nr:DMT family transporter [Coriobacteriia bacterium]